MQSPPAPSGPLEVIHIDIYFVNGTYNLTIIDKFSKFAQAYQLDNRNSIEVIAALSQFMSNFGIPKKLVFDQGAEFSGNMFNNFLAQYDILQHTTSFQQSTGNSTVERLHTTLTVLYRIVMNHRKELHLQCEHTEILTEVLTTYNNAIHSSTNHTPFQLFHGRTHMFEKTVTYDNHHDYLSKLNQFRQTLYPQIQQHLQITTDKRLAKLNVDRETPIPVEENNTIYRKENRRNKTTPRFSLHNVERDRGLTLITTRGQKLHKQKIRKHVERTVSSQPQTNTNT